MTVQFDGDGLMGVAGRVESLADSQVRRLGHQAADAAAGGMAGSGVGLRLVDAGAELAGHADGFDEALRGWADAVRVGGEVFSATDRVLSRRSAVGSQVAR